MRCKACNSLLAVRDYSLKNPHTGLPEDLCPACRFVAHNPDLVRIKNYQFEDLTENVVVGIDRNPN